MERDGTDLGYACLMPPGHSRLCWASAIGSATRGKLDHGEAVAGLWIAKLTGGHAKRVRRHGESGRQASYL